MRRGETCEPRATIRNLPFQVQFPFCLGTLDLRLVWLLITSPCPPGSSTSRFTCSLSGFESVEMKLKKKKNIFTIPISSTKVPGVSYSNNGHKNNNTEYVDKVKVHLPFCFFSPCFFFFFITCSMLGQKRPLLRKPLLSFLEQPKPATS